MNIANILHRLPQTTGIDTVRVYERWPGYATGIQIKEFDFDSRLSWIENFRNNNFSEKFLEHYADVENFTFCIEGESIILEIEINNLSPYR